LDYLAGLKNPATVSDGEVTATAWRKVYASRFGGSDITGS